MATNAVVSIELKVGGESLKVGGADSETCSGKGGWFDLFLNSCFKTWLFWAP